MGEPLAIDAYSSARDAVERQLEYPGRRPAGSFMTDGRSVSLLPSDFAEFQAVADEMLTTRGLPLIADRAPVLAYGANASPPRLRDKMKVFGPDRQDAMQTVPHVTATLPDSLAVWHGRPGQTGSVFAELYRSREPGTSLRAHVGFLTREQLAAVHVTEGATYAAAEIPAILGDGRPTEITSVVGYVALDASILQQDGKPVLVKGLDNTALGLAAMTAEEAVDYMLLSVADSIGPKTAREYIHEGGGLSLAEKKRRQARIGGLLLERGISTPYAYPADHGQLIGRADFDSLPGFHVDDAVRLPEMLLSAIRPDAQALDTRAAQLCGKNPRLTSEAARRKARDVLDPARRIARRAHEELAIRLEKQ